MSAHFSHNQTRIPSWWRSVLAGFLSVLLAIFSIPAPLVFADEVFGAMASEAVVEPTQAVQEMMGHDGELGGQGQQGEQGDPPYSNGAIANPGNEGASTGATEHSSDTVPVVPETPADATIITGNSASGGTLLNEVNTNTLETAFATASDGTSTVRDDVPPRTVTTEALNDNVLTATNSGILEGETGANIASASGTTTIITGDSIVTANVINVVNTNIINSNGLMLFLDLLYGEAAGGIDLRNTFADIFSPSSPAFTTAQSTCSLITCNSTIAHLIVENNNVATIENELIVRSSTGGNSAHAGVGGAYVTTGNAYASANLVNVANTNLVDTNYLLVAINNFGDLSDDVVFPGMDFFLSMLSGGGTGLSGTTAVVNDNGATVTTDGTVIASTGENSAVAGTAGARVDTGNAGANATVVNQVNRNMFGGNNIYILFRVFGEWNGDVFGLPEGLVWRQTPYGIEIMTDPNYEGGASASVGTSGGYASAFVGNKNVATISNNVQVYALTGDNYAGSDQGSAVVDTGDAYASANVVNIANTNVFGTNWILAILNIFGNWSGNLAFGRPDLWIGGRAESVSGDFRPGGAVNYTFTVTNFGDSPATNITLTPTFESDVLSFAGVPSGAPAFSLGDLYPGESIEVTYTAQLSNTGRLLNPQVPVVLSAEVRSRETDNNYDDNREELTIVVLGSVARGVVGGGGGGFRHGDSNIVIEKTLRSSPFMVASSTASYEVVIRNRGGRAYHTTLHDYLFAPDGTPVHHQAWELQTIQSGEEIYITYDVFFKGETKPGVYRNEVFVEGRNKHPSLSQALGTPFRTKKDDAVVTIVGTPVIEDEALGYCPQYLTTYIKFGAPNSVVDVARLQTFLNKFEGFSLTVSGFYDAQTLAAVHAFQNKYADDILYPWGTYYTTGYVYYTTQKKINELYCEGMRTFPLSPAQMSEIDRYRAKLEELDDDERGIFDLGDIGYAPKDDNGAAMLAEASSPAPSSYERPSPQAASVSGATSGALRQSLMQKIRARFNSLMNWISIRYYEARFSKVSVAEDNEQSAW